MQLAAILTRASKLQMTGQISRVYSDAQMSRRLRIGCRFCQILVQVSGLIDAGDISSLEHADGPKNGQNFGAKINNGKIWLMN